MKDEVEALIRLHSITNPVYSAEIEQRFDLAGTVVRDTIRELRRERKPIANSKQGYFWARNFEELRPTIDDLEGRAGSMYETVKALRECFSDNGQLQLL